MVRRPGLSVRWKLTLSYAGFLAVAGALLLAVVWARPGRTHRTPARCQYAGDRPHEALLLLSRGDRGNVARESVDLSLIAEEAAETLLPLAEQRRITLDATGSAARTSGSAELLLRMVTNLVQTAIVHNLPAGGAVTVHTEADGDMSVLRVENTGRRLPPELVPTLTEPFQRGAERVRTDEHAGVGLGLAIVDSVIRAHDGTLDLVPRPAGGVRVTVRLPGRR